MIRTGGQLPTTASAHTLLVAGLTATLMDVSKTDVARILDMSGNTITRPRIIIGVKNSSFADALRGMMKNDQAIKAAMPLRCGRNFLRELARQLARFEIMLASIDAEDDMAAINLRRWVRARLPDPKLYATIPPALSAAVVGCVV